jgi:hypothetical protein
MPRPGGARTKEWRANLTPQEFGLLEALRSAGQGRSRADWLRDVAVAEAKRVLPALEGLSDPGHAASVRRALEAVLGQPYVGPAHGGRPPVLRRDPGTEAAAQARRLLAALREAVQALERGLGG